MGVYVLNLTTKAKKVATPNGSKVEVFTFKYSHKLSGWDDTPRHIKALQARLENVWAKRGTPDYVCWSEEFAADTPVYAPERDIVTLTDDELATLPIVGYLRGAGRQQRFEPWHALEIEVVGRTGSLHEALAGLMRGPWSLRQNYLGGDAKRKVRVYARDEADLAAAKLALA